jgi:AcrR family transcriptional regulator
MSETGFQRARSPESKQERAASLLEAARSLATEQGVASVTLTAIAERAGTTVASLAAINGLNPRA